MKYFVYLAQEQKEFIANLLEPNSTTEQKEIINKFQDHIDEEELEEMEELIIAHIYREKFLRTKNQKLKTLAMTIEDLKKNNPNASSSYQIKHEEQKILSTVETISKQEINRIKQSIQLLPINHKLETLMDICCHTDYEWINKIKIHHNNSSLNEQEAQAAQEKKAKSFSKKVIKAPKQTIINVPAIAYSRDSDDF